MKQAVVPWRATARITKDIEECCERMRLIRLALWQPRLCTAHDAELPERDVRPFGAPENPALKQ